MLVAQEYDVRLVALRHLVGVGVDHLRPGDSERIMSNARDVQVKQFHGTTSIVKTNGSSRPPQLGSVHRRAAGATRLPFSIPPGRTKRRHGTPGSEALADIRHGTRLGGAFLVLLVLLD